MRGRLSRVARGASRPGGHADAALLGLAVLAEQDADVTHHAHQLGPRPVGQLREQRALGVLPAQEADLDQLVREELRLGLQHDRFREPLLADHHGRPQGVSQRAQVAALKAFELVHESPAGAPPRRPYHARMYRDRKVVVVMPAYNAAKTLKRTYDEVMAQGIVDELIVVDDASTDETVQIAASLPHTVLRVHERNRGYGGNQKTCYRAALEAGADVVVMVHPD